jgi:hypothetical protein
MSMLGSKLLEGSVAGDLDYLISNKIHFDEYASKMGKADAVSTVSFKVKQKEPAIDLVSFLESGYDWILDADISTGEVRDGEYLVFLEMQRRSDLPQLILELMTDLQYLTNIKPSNWKFKWYKQADYQPLTVEAIRENVPVTPSAYREMQDSFTKVAETAKELAPEIADLKRLSGI